MDTPITRRDALVTGGVAGAGLLAARYGLDALLRPELAEAQTANCVLTSSRTEGPYFVDEKLNRSDLRTDPSDGSVQTGVPLTLSLTVVNAGNGCAPVVGAQVDLWHANADGLYSDESANGMTGKKYLRGYQVTDASGRVSFTTIYPGWYRGRAIHVHYKVRIFSGDATQLEFNGQLFFDETTNGQVNDADRYDDRGTRDTTNASDMIYSNDGAAATVALDGSAASGFSGSYVVGLSGLTGSSGGTGTAPGGTGPSSPTADKVVAAAVGGMSWRRTKAGTRVLRVKVDTYEPVVVTVRLIRSGKVLARKQTSTLAVGSQLVSLAVPTRYGGGSARVKVTVTDQNGNSLTTNKIFTVPKRKAS